MAQTKKPTRPNFDTSATYKHKIDKSSRTFGKKHISFRPTFAKARVSWGAFTLPRYGEEWIFRRDHKAFYERFGSFLKFYEGFRSCNLSALLKPFHPSRRLYDPFQRKRGEQCKKVSNKGCIYVHININIFKRSQFNCCSDTESFNRANFNSTVFQVPLTTFQYSWGIDRDAQEKGKISKILKDVRL